MRERLRFLLIYFIFWVVFFVIARIVFLTYHVEDAKNLTLEMVFGIFRYGIVMDMSMAAYYSVLPFLWVTFSNFIDKGVFQNSIFSYTFILLTITNLIIVADLEVYNTWNFRLDATPLKFLSSPKEAFISVKSSPILRLFLSYLILLAVASIIVYRIVANKIYDWKHIKTFPFLIYGLLISAALIIPMRGGLNAQKLKQNYVYFSKNNFANVSALNAPWNFISSLLKRASAKENLYTYLPKDNIERIFKSLFEHSGKTQKIIHNGDSSTNVLIILVENLTSKVIDKTHQSKPISPYLNKLKTESIFFENIYAAADRSDKTVVSILSGYPAQPKDALVEFSQKIDNLPFLSKLFNQKGYSTQFYYGGDASFLSIKPYLFASNFEKILEKADFNTDQNVVSLGVDDKSVYAKFLEDHKESRGKAFFSTILTLSTHEPFEVPEKGTFTVSSATDQFLNAINYADKSLENFLETAKKQIWWKNTLIIVVGNHGNSLPETKDKTENFRVPMIWTGGVVTQPMAISNVYSQMDIASTLLAQLSFQHSDFKWSKNIFDSSTKPWAFFTFNDGFGYINNQNKLLFDNVGRIVINNPKLEKSKELEAGKALQQRSFQDFLDL